MATLTVRIDSDNDAFATPEDARAEFVRLLLSVAAPVADGHSGGRLLDINGNPCGHWDCDPGDNDTDD